jgi:uncharacterized membrane protein YqjE
MHSLLTAGARHAGGYLDLFAGVAGEARVAIKRRAGLLAATAVLATAGLVAGWACVVLLVWTLPSRNLIAILTAGSLLAGAAICGWLACCRVEPGPNRQKLSQELKLDRQLLDEWGQTR